MLIGLTGKYCAGKNHIAALIKNRGIPVLDVDKLGHQALENEKEAIFTKFGFELKKEDGSLDRKLLGQKVFIDPSQLAALEAIVHPVVNRLTIEWIGDRAASGTELKTGDKAALGTELKTGDRAASGTELKTGDRACVINAALLHKSVVFNRFDRIILVTSPFFTRFLRAYRRDRLSWLEILKRFASQKDFNSQYLAANAEIYRVENPGLFCLANKRQNLENRIDMILEGIY